MNTAGAHERGSPVELDAQPPKQGIGLCLSGGGYRAMLFHLGALCRLNEVGLLPRLDRIASVSGGSITSAVLALAWNDLDFDSSGVSRTFHEQVFEPVMRFARQKLDIFAVLRGLAGAHTVNDCVAESYRKHLFGNRMLTDLPETPTFVITATNLQSGVLFRFTRTYAGDYQVGRFDSSTIDVATAVAASSAFPPFLSPAFLTFTQEQSVPWPPVTSEGPSRQNTPLHCPPYTTRVVLSDGGVYDNLGLEPLKGCATVFVSDGGARLTPIPRPRAFWFFQLLRVQGVQDNQTRALRKRHLIEEYKLALTNPLHLSGAYWGIGTEISGYRVPTLPCPDDRIHALATVSTRLWPGSLREQKQLVNWGYAVCDATLREHGEQSEPPASAFPYTGVGGIG